MLIDGFLTTLVAGNFGMIVLGVALGIVVGAIPGLTAAMLIALTLPLTFRMDSIPAVVLLVSMYVGGVTGGLISAILLRMPGTPASVVTTFDGYALAARGQAHSALSWAIVASFAGGLVSWFFLAFLSQPMARLGIALSQFDFFALVLVALILISVVSPHGLVKNLISGCLGLLIAFPGIDPIDGQLRMTFGLDALVGGLALLPVLMGLFAGAEIIKYLVEIGKRPEQLTPRIGVLFVPLRDLAGNLGNMLRSSLIGTAIGILPGIGANIGSIVSYTVAKRTSRKPEAFGTGSVEGIVASESGNNATVNGALIPLVALGIPGSVIDAILIGALTIHNIQPGPFLFRNEPLMANTIIATGLVANFVMLAIMVVATGPIARLAKVPPAILYPLVAAMCVLGSYSLSNNWDDVWVMLVFSVFGYFLERFRYPLAPLVIGFVLAPLAETSLRSALMFSQGSFAPFFTSPVTVTALIVVAAALAVPAFNRLQMRRK